MKRAAKTLAVSLAISTVVVACATMQQSRGPYLAARAVQAQGGAEALASASTWWEAPTTACSWR